MCLKDLLRDNELLKIKDIKANCLKPINELIEQAKRVDAGDLVRDNFAKGLLTESMMDLIFNGCRKSDYMVIAARYEILYFEKNLMSCVFVRAFSFFK